MTTEAMLRELEKSINRATDGYSDPDDHYAAIFLQTHGPALVEAVRDADRYRWLRKMTEAPVGHKHMTVVAWDAEPWEPDNAEALDKAIDKARAEGRE